MYGAVLKNIPVMHYPAEASYNTKIRECSLDRILDLNVNEHVHGNVSRFKAPVWFYPIYRYMYQIGGDNIRKGHKP